MSELDERPFMERHTASWTKPTALVLLHWLLTDHRCALDATTGALVGGHLRACEDVTAGVRQVECVMTSHAQPLNQVFPETRAGRRGGSAVYLSSLDQGHSLTSYCVIVCLQH